MSAGSFGEITVQYHVASDRYFVVSKDKDKDGVPYFEMQVNRASANGQDLRKEMAKLVYELMKGLPDAPEGNTPSR